MEHRVIATVTVDGVQHKPPGGLDFESDDRDEIAVSAILACGRRVMDACSQPFTCERQPDGSYVSGRVMVRLQDVQPTAST